MSDKNDQFFDVTAPLTRTRCCVQECQWPPSDVRGRLPRKLCKAFNQCPNQYLNFLYERVVMDPPQRSTLLSLPPPAINVASPRSWRSPAQRDVETCSRTGFSFDDDENQFFVYEGNSLRSFLYVRAPRVF